MGLLDQFLIGLQPEVPSLGGPHLLVFPVMYTGITDEASHDDCPKIKAPKQLHDEPSCLLVRRNGYAERLEAIVIMLVDRSLGKGKPGRWNRWDDRHEKQVDHLARY